MIRYTDHVNDDIRVRSLMQMSIINIKKVVNKKGSKNSDLLILWMSNILRLLHILKQYSGDSTFQKENTDKQNEQCLKNFDLSEYRQVLSDHSVWILQLLIKYLEDQIQSLIVPAILESTCACPSEELNRLKNILEQDYNVLENYGLDVSVIHQIFKQIFYFICAGALNNLLLRRELCHWSKGMDIRFNLTAVEVRVNLICLM
jgi:myosin-5